MRAWGLLLGLGLFAALPATSNYQLNSYGFGSGGSANSGSSNYALEGISGELSGQTATTSNYQIKPGYIQSQQSNVPKISSFDNGSGRYYDKLHFVIDTQSNPTDAKYALQISTTSDFSSAINYVKSDLTIGPTLTTSDYQTYTTWGGASGSNIIGLTSSTAYYLRAKVTHENSAANVTTESAYGPSATATTAGPTLSFDIDVSATDSDTSPPYNTSFGNLLANTVTNTPEKIWVDLDTDAENGASVYVYDTNSGLTSTTRSYTIASASTDLSSASEGYGAQSTSATQTSGGPLTALSPYNVSSQNVGIISTIIRPIYSTSAQIVAGRASFQLKAKSKTLTPPSGDYADSVTVIAAGSF